MKRVCVVILFVIAALGGVLLLFHSRGTPPREAELISKFYEHRQAYERLRDMLLEDEQVRAVYVRRQVATAQWIAPRSLSEVGFPLARYERYRVLLEEIGSTEVFRARDSSFEICVTAWAHGFGGDTRHVDTCWLDRAPVNQVKRLADFYRTPKPRHPVYRHIDGDWYLWADW